MRDFASFIFFLIAAAISVSHVARASDAPSCVGCTQANRACVGDPGIQAVEDSQCQVCISGDQWWWPCNVDGLCWCWDTTKPRVKPAPSSGLEPADAAPCDVFTQDLFNQLAPDAVFPYTYDGLCEAIDAFNTLHEEQFLGMGTLDQQKAEIAAFVGNTLHESFRYTAPREALPCGDFKTVEGVSYCKPCNASHFDYQTMTCSESLVADGAWYEDYCDSTIVPPHGCICGPTSQVVPTGELEGYINPNYAFFGRGPIQLSWNYNYLAVSRSLTGSSDTLCVEPDLLATDPKISWGSAIWFWMENKKGGTTCHIEALRGRFGGALNIVNGGLECPAEEGGSHEALVVTRLIYYCQAATAMGLTSILSMNGCEGLQEAFQACHEDGTCSDCDAFYVEPTQPPTTAPTMPQPTAPPVEFRSWLSGARGGDSGVGRVIAAAAALLSVGLRLLDWL